jgi:hypothetical protein
LAIDQAPGDGLRFGPLGGSWAHLCIDMQRMFAEPTDWYTPWLERVLPNVVSLVELDPARTVFTRFVPVSSFEAARGSWRRYYERWHTMTRRELDPELINLVPALAQFVPPARLIDKSVMSPWHGELHAALQQAGVDTLIVSGSETEVCVLATVMGRNRSRLSHCTGRRRDLLRRRRNARRHATHLPEPLRHAGRNGYHIRDAGSAC